MFVYELSGYGFEFSCSHLEFNSFVKEGEIYLKAFQVPERTS